MVAKVGDRIVIESQKVGQPAREGDILEVLEATYGPHYLVRWDDGHESDIRPAAGSARTFSAIVTQKKATKKGAAKDRRN